MQNPPKQAEAVPTYHEKHKRAVGSGEILAVAGLDPYRSRLDVWERMTGRVEPAPVDSWHITRGNVLEPALLEWLKIRTRLRFERVSEPFRHETHAFVIATPDGHCREPIAEAEHGPCNAEIKAPSPETAFNWGPDGSGAEGVPKPVIVQVTWQMGASGVGVTYVAALIGGFLRVYRVDFNDRLFGALVDKAADFMRHVENDTPPPIDGSKGGEDYLRRRFASHESNDLIAASVDVEPVIERYRELYERGKELDDELRALRNEIKEAIGTHAGIESRQGRIYWKQTKDRAGFDTKALIAHLEDADPELLERFAKTTAGARPFRPYFKKA